MIVLRNTAEMTSAQPATASSIRAAGSQRTRPKPVIASPHTMTEMITARPCRRIRLTQPVVSAPISAPAPGAAYRKPTAVAPPNTVVPSAGNSARGIPNTIALMSIRYAPWMAWCPRTNRKPSMIERRPGRACPHAPEHRNRAARHRASSHAAQQWTPTQTRNAPEGQVNLLSEAGNEITKVFDNVKGWVEDAAPHVETILTTAAKYEASPIVQALEGIFLPPALEAEIAKLITAAATEVGKLTGGPAATSVLADPAAPAASEPPADVTAATIAAAQQPIEAQAAAAMQATPAGT